MLAFETIAFLVTGAVLAGFVMGLVGFGTGLAALGLWLFVVDPVVAVPLVGICSLATTLFTITAYGHAIRLRRLAPFFAGALVALPAGIWLLTGLDPALFKIGMGAFLIAYTLFRLVLMPSVSLRLGSPVSDVAVGAGAGLLAGLAALPGPLTTVWCGLRGWSKDEQRAVYQPFNQTIILIAMAGYAFEGLLTRELAVVSLYCVPASLAGMVLGMAGYKRLNEAQFQKVVLLCLLLSGLMLVGLNVIELAGGKGAGA
ncbi:MAG: sulfite exporter TauE/SafE family protein [Methyloligellaceae bacterium]